MSVIPLILFVLIIFASNTSKTSRTMGGSTEGDKNTEKTFLESIHDLEKRIDNMNNKPKAFSRRTDNPTIKRSIGKTGSEKAVKLDSLQEDRRAYNREQYMKSLYDEDEFEFTQFDDNKGEMENWENLGIYSINTLYNKESMREGIVLKEILDKPLALRKR